jgi:hypothetical protein
MGIHRSLRMVAVACIVMLAWSPLGAWQGVAREGTPLPSNTAHLAVQLTTQQPVNPTPGIPERVYPVDAYNLGSDIWLAIPSSVAGTDLAGATVRVCITPHRTVLDGWTDGAGIKDCSGGFETVMLQAGSSADNYVLGWSGASTLGRYDVIVDFEPFGVYNLGRDMIDHAAIGGFQVLDGSRAIDYIIVTPDRGCARIIGNQSYVGGLYEPTEEFLANGWDNGPNNINEDGGGDDVFQGIVSAIWSTTVGGSVGRIDSSTGLYVAGGFTGEGDVTANYLGRQDTVYVMSTTPSWVP